ncbi:MAG: potassium transporter TrkA, partial [Sphingomonadales bacterium]
HCIVVMDQDPERLAAAEEIGCNVIEADATRDEHLLAVHIDRARTVLVSAGRDDASILIVLTVQHLAPEVPISVVIRSADNELLAQQAGADNVINPVRFTGLLLAGSAQGAHIADYLSDLASVDGHVQLVERPVATAEIGRTLSDLASGGIGLRIYRDGEPLFLQEARTTTLREGDCVVEIVPTSRP